MGSRWMAACRRAASIRPSIDVLGGMPALLGLTAMVLFSVACDSSQFARPPEAASTTLSKITGSGNVVTRDLNPGEFRSIRVRSPLKVDVLSGQEYHVTLTADDNIIDSIVASREGDVLTLEMKPGSYNSTTMQARVTTPALRSLDIGRASNSTISGFKGLTDLELRVSGASKITGRVEASNARVQALEASTVTLGGSAGTLALEASGASQANLGDLDLNAATCRLIEASRATVNVKGKLDAELRGASTLYYVGNPTLGNVATSEASSMRQR